MDGKFEQWSILEKNNKKYKNYGIHCKVLTQFFGPFRDAVGSKMKKEILIKNYQMDPNSNEALTEARLDVSEGADMLLINQAYLLGYCA